MYACQNQQLDWLLVAMFSTHRIGTEPPVKYILPSRITYNMDEHSTRAARNTQNCPFPIIRELILAYTIRMQMKPLPKSQMLMQRYEQARRLANIDDNLCGWLQWACDQSRKLHYMQQSYHKYTRMRDKVFETRVLGKYDYNGYFSQETETSFNEMNQLFLNAQSHYFEYKRYTEQLCNALLIVRQGHIAQEGTIVNASTDYRPDQFLKDQTDPLTTDDLHSEQLRIAVYTLRDKVKRSVDLSNGDVKGLQDLIARCEKKKAGLKLFYQSLNKLVSKIHEQMIDKKSQYTRRCQEYLRFIPALTKVNEISQVTRNGSTYHTLLLREKARLRTHIQKNYGLIVPYEPTAQWTDFSRTLDNNPQLRQHMWPKIEPLLLAIRYVNVMYKQQHRELCRISSTGREGAGMDISEVNKARYRIGSEYVEKFRKYAMNAEDSYCEDLLHSCTKLLTIIN